MPSRRAAPPAPDPALTRQVDAVMAAARVLFGVVASSVAPVDDTVTVPQLRVLVMLATRGPLNLVGVAEGLRVHPSNATRTVDRLVAAGLVTRRELPTDRRHVTLSLTASGRRLVDGVFARRRAAVEQVIARMPESRRRALPAAFESFADAAGELPQLLGDDLHWTQ